MARTIRINDNWEFIEDIQDIIKIIKMYYNYDLAIELEDLIETELYEKDYKISCLEEIIAELEDI